MCMCDTKIFGTSLPQKNIYTHRRSESLNLKCFLNFMSSFWHSLYAWHFSFVYPRYYVEATKVCFFVRAGDIRHVKYGIVCFLVNKFECCTSKSEIMTKCIYFNIKNSQVSDPQMKDNISKSDILSVNYIYKC